MFSYASDKYPEEELLDCMVVLLENIFVSLNLAFTLDHPLISKNIRTYLRHLEKGIKDNIMDPHVPVSHFKK